MSDDLKRPTPSTNEPWYQAGLRFKCTACGDCCTGARGYVWVTNQEIAEMAGELGIDTEEFLKRFVRLVGIRKSLVELTNGDCIFFDNQSRKCEVYASRPRQCRTWPFWNSNIRTPKAWAETCEFCPGSGTGKLHSLEAIEEQASAIKV